MDKKNLKPGSGMLKRTQNTLIPSTDDIDNKFLMPETTLIDGNMMAQGPNANNMFPTPLQYDQYMQPTMWGPNN